ncbi:hypothetical protein RBI13_18665 [Alcaligenaceae bacterium A4P071]|nr:hypothetical protein [Alcaligenaceae bacterium A4P071]
MNSFARHDGAAVLSIGTIGLLLCRSFDLNAQRLRIGLCLLIAIGVLLRSVVSPGEQDSGENGDYYQHRPETFD